VINRLLVSYGSPGAKKQRTLTRKAVHNNYRCKRRIILSAEDDAVPFPRYLVIACEATVLLAVVGRFLLPSKIDISFAVAPHTHVGIPVRLFVPLLLIALAGAMSAFTLARAVLVMMHRAQ
jgi:hypothetical protein